MGVGRGSEITMTSERFAHMDHKELELFRLGTGDDNPVHGYGESQSESDSGKVLVYGGLIVLRGLTDILRPLHPSVIRVSFVFACRIYAGDGCLIRTFAEHGNHDVRIVSSIDGSCLAAGQVYFCSTATPALGPRAMDVYEADKQARTYQPNLAALQAIRSRFELDATTVTDVLLASIGLSSYVVGVEITNVGRLYGIDVECSGDPIVISSLQYTTSLKRAQNGGATIMIDVQAEGVAVARVKLRTHPTRR